MATAMVLVIVSRNIDLSIGSIVVFTAMFMGLLQAEWIPTAFGLGLNQPYTWIVVVVVGITLGALIGGLQGFIVAFVGVPSFIVTLGGLLIWRGLCVPSRKWADDRAARHDVPAPRWRSGGFARRDAELARRGHRSGRGGL